MVTFIAAQCPGRNLPINKDGRLFPQEHPVPPNWLGNLIHDVDQKPIETLHPAVQEFQDHIDNTTSLKILIAQMFAEIPLTPPYDKDPTLQPQVRNHRHLFRLINEIISRAPPWNDTVYIAGFIGFPINAILAWPMATAAGNAFFLRPDVNQHWAAILRAWAQHLATPASADVLNATADGWLGKTALAQLALYGSNGGSETFEELYVCDPTAPHYGFRSWDDFFTRRFRPGVRPLEELPPNFDFGTDGGGALCNFASPRTGEDCEGEVRRALALIYNPCESTLFCLRRNVAATAAFWVKGQPYSLTDMLLPHSSSSSSSSASSSSSLSTSITSLIPHFTHGTIYQAYLDALTYHRWHSPVSGTVRHAYTIPGAYYAAHCHQGFFPPLPPLPPGTTDNEGGRPVGAAAPDPLGPNASQPYLAHVATRAVIVIEADERAVGLVAFVAVGMAEVSSCVIGEGVRAGGRVGAGEEIGMFRFGGSTVCLVVGAGVDVLWRGGAGDGDGDGGGGGGGGGKWGMGDRRFNLPVRSVLAAVRV